MEFARPRLNHPRMSDEDENLLGRRIRAMRKARRWTQEELADRVGLTTGAISQFETGKAVPRWNNLQKIADAFQCPVSDLVSAEGPSDLVALIGEIEDLSPDMRQQVSDYVAFLQSRR